MLIEHSRYYTHECKKHYGRKSRIVTVIQGLNIFLLVMSQMPNQPSAGVSLNVAKRGHMVSHGPGYIGLQLV